MSFEGNLQPEDLAEPDPIEAHSFDSNKFERTLLFERLDEIRENIEVSKTVTPTEGEEILRAMDTLADIGYFFSTNDDTSNRPDTDLSERGIDPKHQHMIDSTYMNMNIKLFDALLDAIYSAKKVPAGLTKSIFTKARDQHKNGVPNALRIVMQIRYLCTHYPQNWSPDDI